VKSSVGVAASYINDKFCQAVSKAIFRFLVRTLKIILTSHYVTSAIQYMTVSTEELSVEIVVICSVDQRVDVVLTRYMTG